MALTRIILRRVSWADALVVLFVGLMLFGLVRVGMEWRAPLEPHLELDLGFGALPLYTFFSLCRGFAAFVLSFLFTLAYGYAAARIRGADRLLLPLLDILQSIPVLGFMPGVVLALAALFPRTNAGLELAAILMIFTGQVWNMTFSFYHSLRSIPPDLLDAGRVYRFGWWRRLIRIELPFATVGLVWNGMMSMAGGWFFLTINEAFRLGDHDFRLPGIGAYMSVAIDRGDRSAMIAAVVAMTIMIVAVDQLFWRPLVAWAERFKFEDVGATAPPRSWVLDLIKRTRVYAFVRSIDFGSILSARSRVDKRRVAGARAPATSTWLSRLFVVGIGALSLWGTVRLVMLLLSLSSETWIGIVQGAIYTLLRTTAAVVAGTIWTVPAGLYIGTHPKASRILQPIVQIAASFPAPMLFPIVLFGLAKIHVGLGIGSIALMILGTQWYILFNVIAGAMSIPTELFEASRVYRFDRRQRWLRLLLPGVFPHLVTGWVTAAGGAWNASIVSEYVHAQGTVTTTAGLGAIISVAAESGDFPKLAASVLMMALVVVAINRTFWRRLYALAERKYALSR